MENLTDQLYNLTEIFMKFMKAYIHQIYLDLVHMCNFVCTILQHAFKTKKSCTAEC